MVAGASHIEMPYSRFVVFHPQHLNLSDFTTSIFTNSLDLLDIHYHIKRTYLPHQPPRLQADMYSISVNTMTNTMSSKLEELELDMASFVELDCIDRIVANAPTLEVFRFSKPLDLITQR